MASTLDELESPESAAPPSEEVERLVDLSNRAGGVEELERLAGCEGLAAEPDENAGADDTDDSGRPGEAA